MKTPDEIEVNGKKLSEIIELHEKFWNDVEGGERAYLYGANLEGAKDIIALGVLSDRAVISSTPSNTKKPSWLKPAVSGERLPNSRMLSKRPMPTMNTPRLMRRQLFSSASILQ